MSVHVLYEILLFELRKKENASISSLFRNELNSQYIESIIQEQEFWILFII